MIDKGDRSAVGYYERLSEALDNEGKAIPQKFTPKETEYMPRVGEWCDAKIMDTDWTEVFILGRGPRDELYVICQAPIMIDELACMFRPIKSDKDVFIERFIKDFIGLADSDKKVPLKDLGGMLFDAKYKAPKDE